MNAGRGNFHNFLRAPTKHILTHTLRGCNLQRLKAKSPDNLQFPTDHLYALSPCTEVHQSTVRSTTYGKDSSQAPSPEPHPFSRGTAPHTPFQPVTPSVSPPASRRARGAASSSSLPGSHGLAPPTLRSFSATRTPRTGTSPPCLLPTRHQRVHASKGFELSAARAMAARGREHW